MAKATLALRDRYWPSADEWAIPRRIHALCEGYALSAITHARPDFGIRAVPVGNTMVPVREEVALDLPFGRLLHLRQSLAPTQDAGGGAAFGPLCQPAEKHRGSAAARP
jgi:poly-beta-hydroxyalkanoate depolymerase